MSKSQFTDASVAIVIYFQCTFIHIVQVRLVLNWHPFGTKLEPDFYPFPKDSFARNLLWALTMGVDEVGSESS